MKKRSNICILLLATILLVSCKFFGNNSSRKETDSFFDAASSISNLALDASSSKQDESTSDAIGEDKKNETSTDMLADAPSAYSVGPSIDKQENKGKLTEEDNKNLYTFLYKTISYQYILISIYNKYTRHYNTIATYGSCDTYRIGCFSSGPSAERKQAIADLEKLNLDQDYTKLSKMLKSAVPIYNTKTLDDTIAEYKKAVSKASEAECRIEIENDYAAAQSAAEDKKKKI
ncbi:hypothetical protein [Borrelia sp. A-FGy1]|uniref:hypothetical protein n=1 Tax=Borrelia sp. A-FGy1 TaxID=2608247 RepID=UPI001E5C0561|nr:hypothetical protein [Borrelia sp. A-FGy1]